MDRPIEQLKKEHRAIKLMLQITEKICKMIGSGEKVPPEHLELIVEFFRTFADKCHHGKEEEILFPALEEAGIPKEGGPIGVMLREHTMFRDILRKMGEAVSQYKCGNAQASTELVNHFSNYKAVLLQHIEKEENILFMMAEMHLPEQKQEEMSRDFDLLETEQIGMGKHEEFHRNLEFLEKTYLQG